jgi:branched-chain amino acid aminotransferase
MMKADGRVVWFNGELVPESEAKISIYDSALMFGDMVFEMTRGFNGRQFKLREHIDRLFTGIKILRIPITITPEEMERAVYETIEANQPYFAPDDEHRILIDVTRGLLGLYHDVVGQAKGVNVIIADFPLRWTVAGMGRLFGGGINCVITSQRAIPASLLDPKIKNRSRIYYMMANIEASSMEGEDNWALLTDPDGFIAEGTGSNFFIVKDGKVITPEPRNILRGISRGYILGHLCPQLGIEAIEKNVEPYDVYTADEAFLASTPLCMLPVTRFNGTPVGTGAVGPVYSRLLKQWGENEGVDIAAQIKKWNEAHQLSASAPTPYRFKTK